MADVLQAVSKWLTVKKWAAMLVALAAIPMFVPLAIPMSVSKPSQDFYNNIVALKPGDAVIIAQQSEAVPEPRAFNSGMAMMLRFLAHRQLKIIFLSFRALAPRWAEQMVQFSRIETDYKYKSGVDYVVFPFLAGDEAALAVVAADMHVMTNDYYGVPTKDLPIMQNIRIISDAKLAIVAGEFQFYESYVRQWPVKYGIKTQSLGIYSTIAPFYGTTILGNLDGVRGWAEFQHLCGPAFYGEEITTGHMRNLQSLAVVLSIVLGNAIYYSERTKKKVAAKTGERT